MSAENADGDPPPEGGPRADRRPRRSMPLRLDPAVHEALATWAAQDLRSLNAHIEWLLRRALVDAGRMPRDAGAPVRRGRPRSPEPPVSPESPASP